MKRALTLAALLAASVAAFAEDAPAPLGATLGASTNKVVVSEVKTERAWKRKIVMVDELGQIHNDEGRIAQTAETEAVNEVAERAGEISDAATASMNDALETMLEATNQMATAGLGIAIAFAPETDDQNLRGFVVKTETQGTTDIQWVWYNAELSLPPNRTVVYESNFGRSDKVKANWGKWEAAGTNLVVGGRVWTGCHRCTVARPSWASGKSCLDLPNETWGGESGMNWGDMTLTHEGAAYFTGYVTNGVTGAVAYFDNGFLKEIK